METVFFFKNMEPAAEESLRQYFAKKIPTLDKLISHFPIDAVVLQVKGEKFSKHNAFVVEFVMKLPIGTISSKEASHLITKAVDLAKDRLVAQIKKQLLHLRRGHRNVKAKTKERIRIQALA